MNIIPSHISFVSLRLKRCISELPVRVGLLCSTNDPTLNRSSEIHLYERSDAIKIHDGIMFVFYQGLLHIQIAMDITYQDRNIYRIYALESS